MTGRSNENEWREQVTNEIAAKPGMPVENVKALSTLAVKQLERY